MSHISKKLKRSPREGASDRQTQQGILPAVHYASITTTGSTHIQQEQSRDSFASSTPATLQQPPAPQSLWDRAYDALAKENPGLVKKYDELIAKEQMAESAPSQTASLQFPAPHDLDTRSGRPRRQVLLNTVIQKGLQRMEDNKPTYKIGRHEIVLPDQVAKAAKFLLWVKDWVGTAVKDSPEASLVWSGVCLILPLFTSPATAAEANRDGFVYVTSRLRYYVALEPLLRRLGQNAGVDEALISAANDHIVDLYQAILDFQLSSVLRFYQSRLKTYARDIVTMKDWEQTRVDIKTREDTVNDDLGQINQLAARQELERLNNTSEDARATMENCLSVATQQLAVSGEQLLVLKQQQAAQDDAKRERLLAEQQKCLQDLYLTQNGKGAAYDWYKGRVERRVEGTCRWFLQHKNFQEWLSQESGPLLVSADPGCGKSVLAKYLVDHELAQLSATICYFFFKDQDQNTILQALCALLHQLFSQKLALIQHAMELYNKKGDKLVQSEESLWTILRDAVRDPQAGPVIFVIDALDECDESQLSSFITNLESMFRDQRLANAKFRVLMTSRPYQHVVNEFYGLQEVFRHIHIPGEEEFEAISQEINSVIQHRVKQLAKKYRLSDKAMSSLNNKLLAIDHRTYLWIYLVFDYLDKRFNRGFRKPEDEIDAAIQTLPKSVNHAYDQILKRSQEDETVNTVKKILSIILAARRPLTLSEMNIAMTLNGQGRGRSIYDLNLDPDVDFRSRLRALCGLFINVHHNKIYFLHQTAREFLVQSSAPTTVSSGLQWHHSITTRYAHSVLAEVCMFYLDMVNSTHRDTFRQGEHHGALFQYAKNRWGDHCREAGFEKGSAMVDLASRLCALDFTSHLQWGYPIDWKYGRYDQEYYIHPIPKSSTNILVASSLGLAPVTELLVSRGADIEARDSLGKTALMLAAESGYTAVTRLLLEKGADVNAKNSHDWTALMLAVDSRHEAVTRLLLENGADVEAKDYRGWTVLMIAARYVHKAFAGLLLEKGDGVEASDDDDTTSLMLAASSSRETVTRLLLEKGAGVEAKQNNGWTALMIAAKDGHEVIARLLLEKGADVEAKDNKGWTALMLAARDGHEFIARLLLEKGADIEAKDNKGWTALMLAAESGHEAVIRLLLEKGVGVEARDDDGWTALKIAASSGHEAVTRLLLDKGADVDAKQNNGATELMRAARYGHEAIARLLLETGADVEAKQKDGWTALMLAAKFSREAVARLLLEKGAGVEARDDDGTTALMLAVDSRHEAVTRLLLENGADVEAKDNKGWTALIIAAESGHEAVTRLLLEKGAGVEAKQNDGWTALMFAAHSGHEAVTRLLLEMGADVEAKDNKGYTALMIASKDGHEAVTRLLLEMGAGVEAKQNNGGTALMMSANFGHEAVTRLLLEKGADVEAKQNDGWTALMRVAMSGHKVIARLLLEKGADVEAKNDAGTTALMLAAESGHEAVTRLLLEKGAGVEARDDVGSTALMLAAESGHEAITRLLLETGADVQAKNDAGTTALMLAAHDGHEAVTRLLLEKGAGVEAKLNDGLTALMIAANFGHEAVTRLLLEKGAGVEAKDNKGWTALMRAARSGHEAIARLLLEKGAGIEAMDDDGTTALMFAAYSGHEAVTRLLLEKGADVEAKDYNGWTALRHASKTTTRLLLDNGAQVETNDVEGGMQIDA